MECRFCEEPMEREDCYQTRGSAGIVNKAATYACRVCGRAYWWELGVPGFTPLFAPEDVEEPPPYDFWEESA